jgi:hypothetical protein
MHSQGGSMHTEHGSKDLRAEIHLRSLSKNPDQESNIAREKQNFKVQQKFVLVQTKFCHSCDFSFGVSFGRGRCSGREAL